MKSVGKERTTKKVQQNDEAQNRKRKIWRTWTRWESNEQWKEKHTEISNLRKYGKIKKQKITRKEKMRKEHDAGKRNMKRTRGKILNGD